MITLINPESLLENQTFTQVAVCSGSRIVYTSGQVSINKSGELVGGDDLAAQTHQAMQNLRAALAATGAGFGNVVKTTTFVVGLTADHRQIITDAKKPFWEGRQPPPSALIGVSALARPEWLIEIEAVAVLD